MRICTTNDKERRLGVIGIVIEDREKSAAQVNALLSQYGDIIVGRMGIPYRAEGVSVISLIVDGTTDEVGALTGRLGSLPGVYVKSALTAKRLPEKMDRL
ncbi:MAG: CopG family transcriptional regulator [Firmicutes bacterium]|nr:CopG family transcriptional regulator [Bacillota bacterium]